MQLHDMGSEKSPAGVEQPRPAGYDEEYSSFLQAQAAGLVSGGTETSSTFLTVVTYYLLTNGDKLERLQRELRDAFSTGGGIDNEAAKRLPYLGAVIEEGLRILPPAAFWLPRVSPGAVVDDVFVPKGVSILISHSQPGSRTHKVHESLISGTLQTLVQVPQIALSRSSRYFYDPHEFHPGRWLPIERENYDSRFEADVKYASRPFSTGPRNCVGIYLAYMEWRLLLGKLAWTFHWEPCTPNHSDLLKTSKLKLAWQLPPIRVRFVHRQEIEERRI